MSYNNKAKGKITEKCEKRKKGKKTKVKKHDFRPSFQIITFLLSLFPL